MVYRIFRNGNKKNFVETTSEKLAKSIYKEETKKGYKMTIKARHGSRWYTINPETLTT
jgi:hypothetical protein